MEIRTRFRIGDFVWGILGGRAHGFEIQRITIYKDLEGDTRIGYSDENFNNYAEHQCFLSKDELRDYFMEGE